MARIFMTGASGFIGAATLNAALAANHDVLAVVRPGRATPRLPDASGRLAYVAADLRDSAAISKALAAYRPDSVIHLAWTGVANTARFDRAQISDNIDAACALVEAAASSGCRTFIGFGSQGEYGPLNRRISEDDTPQPTTLYGAAKAATLFLTRQLAAQAEMRFVWLRLFSSYGPNDNDNWLIPTLIREMLAGRRPRTTLGTQYWDWLYVDDVAQAVMAVLNSDAAGVFNLGSGRPVQVRRVVELLRDMIAPDMELTFGEIAFRPDQVMHMEADITRLVAATGWRPQTNIEDGLARTVAWNRERLA